MLNIVFVIYNNIMLLFWHYAQHRENYQFPCRCEKIDTLDSLAAAQDRSRSYLINEAITNYIELHAYQDALVRQGLKEMRNGRVVTHEEVLKRLKRTGRARP